MRRHRHLHPQSHHRHTDPLPLAPGARTRAHSPHASRTATPDRAHPTNARAFAGRRTEPNPNKSTTAIEAWRPSVSRLTRHLKSAHALAFARRAQNRQRCRERSTNARAFARGTGHRTAESSVMKTAGAQCTTRTAPSDRVDQT
ncbi:hypothetical protein J2W54_002189 [Rhodococcus fascians]|nr:hypothetical protein [Rhodococcus sp. 3258]MDR6931807.1 hypothetical protein [Rhodococcus fascians]